MTQWISIRVECRSKYKTGTISYFEFPFAGFEILRGAPLDADKLWFDTCRVFVSDSIQKDTPSKITTQKEEMRYTTGKFRIIVSLIEFCFRQEPDNRME
jgi:hypothetical protein